MFCYPQSKPYELISHYKRHVIIKVLPKEVTGTLHKKIEPLHGCGVETAMAFTRSGVRVLFMASPQLENGFTRIANEILEQLSRVQMSGTEWQFVMCLFRKTYGYNKTEDWITGSQIVVATGMKKERVSEAKKRLLERQIVTENRNKISFQKDWEKWKELRKSVTGVTEKRNKVLRKSVNTKERKKLIQKTISEQGSQKEKTMENLIPEIIKLFEAVDPKNKTYYGNKTQRAACQFLLEEYGFEEIRKRIEVLPTTNGMPFFPNITTPCQLRDKWVTLEAQVKRHKTELQTKNNVVAF